MPRGPNPSSIDAVLGILKRRHPGPAASERATPWECLLFTMLTARSRDAQVEGPFQALMAAYPGPATLAGADVRAVERIISGIGLHAGKARNAVAMARVVMERHAGKVPADLTALVALPGVGRKTASCVLVYSFGVPAIPVDTHVQRIVQRLGWTRPGDPGRTERELRRILPRRHWLDINRVMVQFGRETCRPVRPMCATCPIARHCAYPKKRNPSAT